MRGTVVLATFGGGVAHASVAQFLSVGGVTPDFPLLVIALVALRRGPEAGCLAGFAAGLLQDLAGGGLLGVQAMAKALAGFGFGLASGRLWADNPLVQVPAVVALTAVEGLLRFGILQLVHFPAGLGPLLGDVILPQALYNGAVCAGGLMALALFETYRQRASWR